MNPIDYTSLIFLSRSRAASSLQHLPASVASNTPIVGMHAPHARPVGRSCASALTPTLSRAVYTPQTRMLKSLACMAAILLSIAITLLADSYGGPCVHASTCYSRRVHRTSLRDLRPALHATSDGHEHFHMQACSGYTDCTVFTNRH